ncbi:unnamed protein product, partial [Didymodactylos carnosus]
PKEKKIRAGGKIIHPSSRKAKQLSRRECHVGRVIKQRQNTRAKYNNLRQKLLWFKENLDLTHTKYSKNEFYDIIKRYLNRFQDELEQIDLKNQIGERQKTPQYVSRKSLIATTTGTEKNEFESIGLEIPNLTQASIVEELKKWDGSIRFMSRLKLSLVKKSLFDNENSNGDDLVSTTVSIDVNEDDDDNIEEDEQKNVTNSESDTEADLILE